MYTPVVGNACVSHASTNTAVRTHQREYLTTDGSSGKTSHCTVVYKYWGFCHHYKI